MDSNGLKAKLKKGECIYGPFVRSTDPVITEIMGYGGFDYVILDTEHGPMNILNAENLVRSAKLSGTSPIIRVRENSETLIVRALDTGAAGVQIPQINTVDSAKNAIRHSKFFPEGNRGVCKYTRNAEYAHVPVSHYFQDANQNSLVVLQVEGMEGVRNIDEILAVEGIDVLFIGPFDLSQSLGLTGQVTHPEVFRVIEEVTKKARDRGVAVGCFADTIETIEEHRNLGIQYLCSHIDTGIVFDATKSFVDKLHKRK